MDIRRLAKKVQTLSEWSDALQSEGRISDPDRRDLVACLEKGKLASQDKENAMALAMGSLSGMQDINRCYEWWAVVSQSPEGIRAARQKGLPFSATVLGSEARWEFIEKQLKDRRPQCAWLLWSHACKQDDRESLLPTVIDFMGRQVFPDIEGNPVWMQDLTETASKLPLSRRYELMGNLLCDRMSFQSASTAAGLSVLVSLFFPEGVSQDQVSTIESAIIKRAYGATPPGIESLPLIMAPWVALHASQQLDGTTPSRGHSSASRRL
jgi:hypothetical protein